MCQAVCPAPRTRKCKLTAGHSPVDWELLLSGREQRIGKHRCLKWGYGATLEKQIIQKGIVTNNSLVIRMFRSFTMCIF